MREKPFVGLSFFEENDSDFFCGRQADCELLAANAMAAPITVLYAPSGFGKSSILRAGLVPLLRDGIGYNAVVTVDSDWNNGVPGNLIRPVEPCGAGAEPPRRHVFILDQFEEALRADVTPCFLNDVGIRLAQLLEQERWPTSIVIALREDALAALDRLREVLPGVFDNLLPLNPLTDEGAREALIVPLSKFDSGMSEGLITKVLSSCKQGGAIQLPYLQLFAEKLWDKAVENQTTQVLDESLLAGLGDGDAVFRDHVRDALSDFSLEDKRIIAKVFDRVVPESGGKLPHSLSDLEAKIGLPDNGRLGPLLERLCSQQKRLLAPITGSDETRLRKYQLFHDVLGKPVLTWTHGIEETERQRRSRQKLYLASALLALGCLAAGVSYRYFDKARQAEQQALAALEHEKGVKADADEARTKLEGDKAEAEKVIATAKSALEELQAQLRGLKTSVNSIKADLPELLALKTNVQSLDKKFEVFKKQLAERSHTDQIAPETVKPLKGKAE